MEVVLLDIEGTVCPISFVKNVLYPYSLKALPGVLATQWDSPFFAPYRNSFPEEHSTSPEALSAHFNDLVSHDVKVSYLKDLQGYLWVKGYESGEIRCPLFPDVHSSFLDWQRSGIPIVVYSSGSVAAQKLLFQYTNSKPDADLRPLISGYFDTVNAGMKKDASSYHKIAASRKEEIGKWLFLSDRVEEVEAAKEAGMQSLVVVRDGNAPLTEQEKKKHELVTSFDEIEIAR
ncbi:2,3-diketo-5-methylthio-1-phosphopentane phosphatase [Stipitochalara longipes BDJ]|nr:2,3-diketo-5-methylthio-1-phosphopentane phosphatase [Stipitochalara longipes BDJ]